MSRRFAVRVSLHPDVIVMKYFRNTFLKVKLKTVVIAERMNKAQACTVLVYCVFNKTRCQKAHKLSFLATYGTFLFPTTPGHCVVI